jgi:MFS family permease
MSLESTNPYAPPESAAGELRVKGDLKSYRIHGGQLYVTSGAILPDVCLETGRVEGELTRINLSLRPVPDRAYLYLALGLFFGVWGLGLLFAPWLLVAGFVVHLFFRRSIEANLCCSEKARARQRGLEIAKLLVGVGVVAFIALAPFDVFDRLVFGLSLGLLSQFLLRRLDQSFRVVKIEGEMAILSRVHPEALMLLKRWRRVHLSKLLPGESEITDA